MFLLKLLIPISILLIFGIDVTLSQVISAQFTNPISFSNITNTTYMLNTSGLVNQSVYVYFNIKMGAINAYYNRNQLPTLATYDYNFAYNNSPISDFYNQFIFDYTNLIGVSTLYITLLNTSANNSGYLEFFAANTSNIEINAATINTIVPGQNIALYKTPNFTNDTAILNNVLQLTFNADNTLPVGYFYYFPNRLSLNSGNIEQYNGGSTDNNYLFCNASNLNAITFYYIAIFNNLLVGDPTMAYVSLSLSAVNACVVGPFIPPSSEIFGPIYLPAGFAAPLGIIGAGLFITAFIIIYRYGVSCKPRGAKDVGDEPAKEMKEKN